MMSKTELEEEKKTEIRILTIKWGRKKVKGLKESRSVIKGWRKMLH